MSGGNFVYCTIDNVLPTFLSYAKQASFRGASTNSDAYALDVGLYQKAAVSDGAALRISGGSSGGFDKTSYKGIKILDFKTNNSGWSAYGVWSSLNKGSAGSNNYNFYAAGDAPNYFNGGIQFDIAAGANALGHYEEGTWTPAFELSDGAGTFSYAVQSGSYTRVGRLVTCQGRMQINLVSGTH